ncbi:MAG: helix-turn-helix domain-containing protein [Lachnospiraceae bacterium]|nr:helix-turn-helix domain-containing protein [Lachnospiraceae bacterium]
MEIDYTAVGRRIKQRRKELKMSQEMLAEMIDVSVPHMSNIENGKTKFSLQVLVDAAHVLKTTPDVLLLSDADCQEKTRGLILREIDSVLSDCTPAQMTLIEEVVRNTRQALREYDRSVNRKKKQEK